jgi:Na+-driven multidrug efflux pump
MPGLYFFMLCDLYRRFLNSFGKNVLPMLSVSASVSLHGIWLYIFLVKYKMQIEGIALAGLITNLLSLIFMRILMYFSFSKEI